MLNIDSPLHFLIYELLKDVLFNVFGNFGNNASGKLQGELEEPRTGYDKLSILGKAQQEHCFKEQDIAFDKPNAQRRTSPCDSRVLGPLIDV